MKFNVTYLRQLACSTFTIAALALAGCASHSSDSAQGGSTNSFERNSRNPEFTPATHFAAGQLAESQGNNAAAIAQYEAAIKQDSKHAQSAYRLGILYAQTKDFNKAIAAWQKYVKATENSAAGYSNLAFCCELAGRNDDAEAAYKKGIAKDPKNVPCQVNYGLMLARHGHINEATIHLQAVLTAAEVHYNLASVFEVQGRKSQAREEYQKAVALNPDFGDAKTRMAGLDQNN